MCAKHAKCVCVFHVHNGIIAAVATSWASILFMNFMDGDERESLQEKKWGSEAQAAKRWIDKSNKSKSIETSAGGWEEAQGGFD